MTLCQFPIEIDVRCPRRIDEDILNQGRKRDRRLQLAFRPPGELLHGPFGILCGRGPTFYLSGLLLEDILILGQKEEHYGLP